MSEKLFVSSGATEDVNKSCYYPPHHTLHPWRDKKLTPWGKLRTKLGFQPTIDDHLIIVFPETKYRSSGLQVSLECAFYNKETAKIALQELSKLKAKHFKPPRRAVLIHEKVHYQEELRSRLSSILNDTIVLLNYLDSISHPDTRQLHVLGLQACMLKEIESITTEMRQINSKEYVVVKLCSLLEQISGNDYESKFKTFFRKLGAKSSIQTVGPHLLGKIFLVIKDKKGFMADLFRNNFSISPENVALLETTVVKQIEYYIQNPKQYLFDLSNAQIDLQQVQAQIQTLASELRSELLKIIFDNNVPSEVKEKTILFRHL